MGHDPMGGESRERRYNKPEAQVTVAIIIVLAGLLAGCQVFSTPKPSPSAQSSSSFSSPYAIPALLDLTGPNFEQEMRDVKPAMEALVGYVNKYRGGVQGRQVAFRYYDHEDDAGRARIVWRHAVADLRPAVALAVGAIGSEAVKPFAERDRIPVLAPTSTANLLYPPGWVFSVSPDYAEGALTFFRWALGQWREERPMRVAFLTADASFARAVLRAIPDLERHNIAVVISEYSPVVPVNIVAQVNRIREARPDFVYSTHHDVGLALLLRTALRLGMQREMRFVTGTPIGPLTVADEIGVESAEGLLQVVTASYGETDAPGVREMLAAYREFDPNVAKLPVGAVWRPVYAAAVVLLQALDRAVLQVGWDNLNGDLLYKTLDNSQFDLAGLTKPIVYAPDRRNGSRYGRVFALDGGKPVAVSDWVPVASIPVK